MGFRVGALVGDELSVLVGTKDGRVLIGAIEGASLGCWLNKEIGPADGLDDLVMLGFDEGEDETGAFVGFLLGLALGLELASTEGTADGYDEMGVLVGLSVGALEVTLGLVLGLGLRARVGASDGDGELGVVVGLSLGLPLENAVGG